ncbi:MAG: DegV family EDD domain-containing protein [Ruminococcaceae bacterium]|nr:DegV family EDD domain-containing protein [Oscillospiraceae bacterium]
MGIKKYLEAVFDPEQDLRTRLFMQPTMILLLAELFMLLYSFAVGQRPLIKGLLGCCFLITAVVAQWGYTVHKMNLSAAVISFLVDFILMPAVFFFSGGGRGGSPIWFVAFALYISLVMSGKLRVFFIIVNAAVASACYVLYIYHPELMMQRSEGYANRSSLFALLIVSTACGFVVSYAVRSYGEEIARSEQREREIEKLNRAQNQFFSNMSHEIRTPINTIVGLNEMILREDISDEVAEDAMNIQAASKMLLHLINDILDMSKIESGKMEITAVTYDTGAMLSELVGMLWIRAKEKGLEFHIDVDPMLPAQLVGDEVKIKQILINLLTNAIKYTSEGSVTLSMQYRQQEDGMGLVTYTVTDTGMGLKKESIPHLFSAFRRVDEEKNRLIEGTGLGLAIVKQFVDLMGGTIRVNSVYMQGSSFIVELPQKAAADKQIGELNLELRHSIGHRRRYRQSFEAPDARILVVDDNSTNLLVVRKLLRDTRVKVETVESGKEALKKTLETQYHLIFMDHMMPEMDGIECLHEIRRQVGGLCRETKVVALTANAGSDTQALYVKEGFDGYLLKPVNGDELERELLRMLPRELIRVIDTDLAAADDASVSVRRREKKLQVVVTTDSVCDLPRQTIKSREIAVLPYHVRTGHGIFLDGVEAESRDVLEYMTQQRGELRSEPPEASEYEKFFARQLLRANNVIHITMASGTSLGYAAATEATQTFDNVFVVDSGHLSTGLGLMVLAADQMAKNGVTAEKILQELERLRPRLRTSFIVDSTEFLARSGRISRGLNHLIDGLMVHPVLVMRKRKMVTDRIFIGARSKTWKQYIKWAFAKRDTIDRRMLFITYTKLTRAELDEVAAEIKKLIEFEEVIFQETSPAISSNCGPGTLGLSYMTVD